CFGQDLVVLGGKHRSSSCICGAAPAPSALSLAPRAAEKIPPRPPGICAFAHGRNAHACEDMQDGRARYELHWPFRSRCIETFAREGTTCVNVNARSACTPRPNC